MGRNAGVGAARSAKGFTLGELMVTVAIVGIPFPLKLPFAVSGRVRSRAR